MRLVRWGTEKTSAEVMSGILNCVCRSAAEAWVEPAGSSSARASVERTGVRSGSESFRAGWISEP
jgi:hypothetical protein